MKKKKFYAVKVGKTTGIFNNWQECKNQVFQVPNAVFKSFESFEEAKNFLKTEEIKKNDLKKDDIDLNNIENDEAIAYIDGSYKLETLEYGYGVVLFVKNEKFEFFAKGKNSDVVKSRNVTGELFSSIRAISEAIKLEKKKITIFYDYEGIASWANNNWKCKIPLTIGYKEKINQLRKEIEINFVKIKAHSGNKYNDRADFLAKKSLGI